MSTVLVPTVCVPPVAFQVPLTVMVEPFEVSVPPVVIVTFPAVTARSLPLVVRFVVEPESEIVRVPPRRRPLVAIVKVWASPALDSKVTLLNSSSERLAPANVMVPAVESLNSTVPLPASQEELVVALVHVLVTVHVSEPKSR
jgi:hypothetical protein